MHIYKKGIKASAHQRYWCLAELFQLPDRITSCFQPQTWCNMTCLFWHLGLTLRTALDTRLPLPLTQQYITPHSHGFVYDGPVSFSAQCTASTFTTVIYEWSWLMSWKGPTTGGAAIAMFHQSIKTPPAPPSNSFIHFHFGAQSTIVNLLSPWEKMNAVVLKLINAPINDLSVFASQLGFFFFFYTYVCNCTILSFVYLYISTFTYVDDTLIHCQFIPPMEYRPIERERDPV